MVEIEEVEPEEEIGRVGWSSGVCGSRLEGVAVSGEEKVVVMGFSRSRDGFCSWALVKVLRTVGLVADSVSSRRLVAFFPKAVGATVDVSSDSFGRFEGDGDEVGKSCCWLLYVVTGDEGKTARDILRV